MGYNGQRTVNMFHYGSDHDSKHRIMSQYCGGNSSIRILVTTIACGMGIQIPDVLAVVLWELSNSTLQYWQEVGRCGRDGRHGVAIRYAFKRSVQYCKTCRRDRKGSCPCNSRKHLLHMLDTIECHCVHLIRYFLLKGMPTSRIDVFIHLASCDNACVSVCRCSNCLCCLVYMNSCECSSKIKSLSHLLNFYLQLMIIISL
jgi:superfamily II DNA helicase RecQ